MGSILASEGDFASGLDKDLESLAIRKNLAGRDESNTQWQNDLSWSYISVGDLLYAKKDFLGALTNYRTAQAIERKLVQRDSATLELQNDLTVICQKVGDVLRAQGRTSEALDNYRECVELGKNLVGKDPTNGEWAGNLAFACYSAAMALTEVSRGPTDEARTLLKQGRDILVALQTQGALTAPDESHLKEIQAALDRM
jgi:tetratricopeptide (TPR) repeat protein